MPVSWRGVPETRWPANPVAGFGHTGFKGVPAKRGVDTASLYKGAEAAAGRI